MKRKPYPSDLSDAEWKILAPLIPQPKHGGRPGSADMREVVKAIFYVLKTGCQWALLPHDFPAKGTVYHYFNSWRKAGVWEQWNRQLREQLRREMGRAASPSGGVIDSQSVKTTEKGGCGAMTGRSG
jgi:transposase